ILPGLMPSLREFKKLEPAKISLMTKPFILRRLKSDVLKELPDKIESVHMSELTKEQKELYVAYLKDIQREATDSINQEGFQAKDRKSTRLNSSHVSISYTVFCSKKKI